MFSTECSGKVVFNPAVTLNDGLKSRGLGERDDRLGNKGRLETVELTAGRLDDLSRWVVSPLMVLVLDGLVQYCFDVVKLQLLG